jgi:simple sugar transport system ATP-binding protein
MEVLKTIKKVQNLGNIAIILITHNEIHARLIADRFTFLSLGEVIGSGLSENLGNEEVKRLMAGGAKIGDLAKELEI